MRKKFFSKRRIYKLWYRISDKLPNDGDVVETKIDDDRGCRNETQLMFKHNMWFFTR